MVKPRLQFGVAELNGDGRVQGSARSELRPLGERRLLASRRPGLGTSATTPCSSAALEVCGGGELHAYRDDGFWDCMDTYKDAVLLDDLVARRGPVEGLGRRLTIQLPEPRR